MLNEESIPSLLEVVHIEREEPLFLVTNVDFDRRLATVFPLTGPGGAHREIPFHRIRPSHKN